MTEYVLSNVIPEPPDKRNFMLAVPAGVIQNLPASVDLRAYTGAIENQGRTNSCVANRTASQLEYFKEKAGQFLHLSREFLYWNAGDMYDSMRGKDNGRYPSDCVRVAAKLGVCAEITWPFDPTKINVKPTPAAYAEAALCKVTKWERVGYWGREDNWQSIDLLKATLAMGYPVGVPMFVCSEIFAMKGLLGSATNRYDKIVSSTAEYIGGHDMLIVGYTADGYGILENSWDTTWGDNGYGLFSFASINQACFDAIVVTEFDGVAFAPNWSMLPVPPLTAAINATPDVQYKVTDADTNIFAKVLTAVPAGGTPAYEYEWSTTDRCVAMERPYGDGGYGLPDAVAQPQVSFDNAWPKGEQRSVTVTCLVSDYSLPRETTTVQTLLRLCNDIDRESTKGKAYRLYQAAFNRLPDVTGLDFWMASLNAGVSLSSVAGQFISSAEFQALYGATDSTQFITLIYQNVLGREPDAAGLAYWVSTLDAGAAKADVLVGFSESAENKARVSW
jgi:hypothetical protein